MPLFVICRLCFQCIFVSIMKITDIRLYPRSIHNQRLTTKPLMFIFAILFVVSTLVIYPAFYTKIRTVASPPTEKMFANTTSASAPTPKKEFIHSPESLDANKTGRYVTMCPNALWDGRRLGNHLFNFAAMLHVAKSTGRRVAMLRNHPNGWLDGVFNLSVARVDNIDRDTCPCYTLKELPPMIYDDSLTSLSPTNVTDGKSILVCGFTQSWKYTVGIEEQLRQYLRPHESLSKAVDLYLQEVVPERWSRDPSVAHKLVGIHIRTGDIMSKHMASAGFCIPEIPYFRQAMQHVVQSTMITGGTSRRRRIQFIVFTETVDWCRKRLNLSSVADDLTSPTVDIDLIFSIGKTAQFDFVLLTKSDVMIITSGSYGWWGAWLANGTTIYYRNYPTPGSKFAQQDFRREDYYPSNWIPLGGPWFKF